MNKLCVTILAGGMGKRMQSDLPKVLHQVHGDAMIVRLIREASKLNPVKIIIVVGKFREIIQREIEKHINDKRIIYVDQPIPQGTGHAVHCTLNYLDSNTDNIILNGDVPLIKSSTIHEIYNDHKISQAGLSITSINLSDPTNNGRIIIDEQGEFKEIVEERDCNDNQKKINLVNCGIYVSSSHVLKEYIPKITNDNQQQEYYLTDLVKIYNQTTNHKINLFVLPQEKQIEIYNVNTRQQLEYVEGIAFY
ncbi:putative UDP-N-acetylglucosamine pyrophosphorylase [Cotonvirus japonicus]|uniref:UDP-N-acetylglucosamine diphosphorylase n=1 Tax=Cotonvirus japonicus TaxID=2811091 RepID=A0ABM7NRT7_9VIRU|nr:putative UDP-N-acetylglucosamine pyrophosphorylase [Cotonvirus japonicus]BCS82870.1 putative UDP-N-acetylglucosamine pyrophosphorylase [Cotonvirus japonicus]